MIFAMISTMFTTAVHLFMRASQPDDPPLDPLSRMEHGDSGVHVVPRYTSYGDVHDYHIEPDNPTAWDGEDALPVE